ncbi:MAG: hypothetical protein AB1473_00480 [Thermodesulfobacteriota bacterium]
MVELKVDERKVAIEAIATLCHVKRVMADLLLKPAGVPQEVYGPLLYRRDETGWLLSKRQIAPFIIDACDKRPEAQMAVRRIVEIAATWSAFHLAGDEYAARATVQKARELLGIIETMQASEARAKEIARQEELANLAREKADLLKQQSDLLLMMFDNMARSEDPKRRGYLLEDLLNRLFDLHEIPVVRGFKRNQGAEQIDGAFKLEGWHYIVECRWREKLADIRQLDGLLGQVIRSGKQTMGLFLSVNGWSHNVPSLLKQNPDKGLFLMDGYDLRCVLALHADLGELLLAKLAHLNLEAEPFLSVKVLLEESNEP